VGRSSGKAPEIAFAAQCRCLPFAIECIAIASQSGPAPNKSGIGQFGAPLAAT